jgi:hypothetical protein
LQPPTRHASPELPSVKPPIIFHYQSQFALTDMPRRFSGWVTAAQHKACAYSCWRTNRLARVLLNEGFGLLKRHAIWMTNG